MMSRNSPHYCTAPFHGAPKQSFLAKRTTYLISSPSVGSTLWADFVKLCSALLGLSYAIRIASITQALNRLV